MTNWGKFKNSAFHSIFILKHDKPELEYSSQSVYHILVRIYIVYKKSISLLKIDFLTCLNVNCGLRWTICVID